MRASGVTKLVLTGVILGGCGALFSQNPQLDLPRARRFPTVVFSSVLWSADPSFYSIAVDSSGTATYESLPSSQDGTGVPYTVEFQVSDRTRRIAFNLAQRLNYFAGRASERVVSPAASSVRTLAYIDFSFNNRFTYTAPSDNDIYEITSVFEELSETLEHGHKLSYLQQHDKAALAPELQKLQANVEHRHMREFQALAPVLRSLSSDQTLDAATRSQAEGLLKVAENSR